MIGLAQLRLWLRGLRPLSRRWICWVGRFKWSLRKLGCRISRFFVDGQPCRPVHVEEDKIWLPSPPQSHASHIREDVHLATPDWFRAFGKAWAARWLWHTRVDPDRWHAAVSGLSPVRQAKQMEYSPVTVAQWRQALMSKTLKLQAAPDWSWQR